jgi:hypothetical protein
MKKTTTTTTVSLPQREKKKSKRTSSSSTDVGRVVPNSSRALLQLKGAKISDPSRLVGASGNLQVNSKEFYEEFLTKPDIIGPIRIPREGSPRTTLGYDQSRWILNYNSAKATELLIMHTVYTQCGANYYNANPSANYTFATNGAPGVQFPSSSQVTEVNLTSACMIVSYLGSPLNAQGEVLLGNIPTGIDPASFPYNLLALAPGVVSVPMAALIEKPLRISFVKNSASANTFIGPTVTADDSSAPFVAYNGMSSGGSLLVQFIRCWEVKGDIAVGEILPFESGSVSYSKHRDWFDDAEDYISKAANLVTEVVKHPLTQFVANSLLGSVLPHMGQVQLIDLHAKETLRRLGVNQSLEMMIRNKSSQDQQGGSQQNLGNIVVSNSPIGSFRRN